MTPAAGRTDHDRYTALVSVIASGALTAGREASVDRALGSLSKQNQGFVYEGALTVAPHAAVAPRRRIVARALAFTADAEALQAAASARRWRATRAGSWTCPT